MDEVLDSHYKSYMRSNRGKQGGEQDSILASLHENSPISVVKAARASLKEPSRPFTPDSSSRRLGGGEGGPEALRESSLTRLGTSHGQAPSSRLDIQCKKLHAHYINLDALQELL